ncbi:MAG: isoprenylcysteine carboxylmethyltransferase family protein [Chromatiales bacterium]|jgi:protein-S-isoprenylcysteine O-methyltransferase Ste14|nr:MAG: isoprenylcysteine carboxylmethyltransferase family protein [Chromatiales bacterium]
MRLTSLELRIPPPAIGLLIAGAMWAISLVTPVIDVSLVVRAAAAIALALLGGGISFAGVSACRRAQTTVNPMKPQTSSSLVSGGIYAVTRNPMYLGLSCILLGWSVFLASVWTLPGPAAFVMYMTRFQIVPEERVLLSLFGANYTAYTAKVRRWL